MVLAAVVLFLQDPDVARAESLLHARQFTKALAAAEQLLARGPRDPGAHLLLGRTHFARPVVGRYAALEHFRAAARLAPTDPEPPYWQMQVGLFLGSDEGDGIAREAVLQIFALDPDYRDAWARFRELYHNPDIWRRAERALANHAADPATLARRAELLIALEEPAAADSLLAVAMARRPAAAAMCLLRAEANFQAGRERAGYAWHDSALARADDDSTGALWSEAWLIAAPEEAARYAATPPGGRQRFFEVFWNVRDPNLVTPDNERLREHYVRRAAARRLYRLVHPRRTVYRSATARAMAALDARAELADLALQAPEAIPGGASDAEAAASRVAALDPRELQDTALARASRAGLDARGLLFVRHGAPDVQVACHLDPRRPLAPTNCVSALDAEGWLYWTPDGPLTINFRWKGEFLHPVSRAQVRSARTLLRTDRTALPAPLQVRGWSAFFQSGELDRTDVYHRAEPGPAAVVLWRADGAELARAAGTGPLGVTVPPGRYRLGLDADSGGRLGRVRGEIAVPAFPPNELRLSSLVLARLDSLPDPEGFPPGRRGAALGAMPASLVYPGDAPLAAYTEIYGLAPDPAGLVRYEARYTFERVRSFAARLLTGGEPISFAFVREAPDAPLLRERLVLEPGRVPPGRYRVTLSVTDRVRNVKSEAVALEITIR